MASPFKTVTMRNLSSAIWDARSSVDEVPLGSFRWKENFAISPDSKLVRALGWRRLYTGGLDFHDNGGIDEPMTLLFESTSNEGVRRLFGATKTRILVMNEAAGTWDTIGTGFGADGSDSLTQIRFHAAELQNKVVFTNNFDPPQIHTLGTGVVATIPTLSQLGGAPDTTELTKAKVVIAWQGFVFLMNVVEDGDRYASRIRWSHLNMAEFWTPGIELDTVGYPADSGVSLADWQDLIYGDEIQAAVALGGYLYVLTNRGIDRCSISVDVGTDLVPGTVSLSVVHVYREQKTQAKCIAYPNSLVSDGAALWYAGRDAIYRFTPGQDSEPERVEWVHRSTSVIFKDAATRIDKTACESPIMEFRPASNEDDTAGGEIHFSWPTERTGADNGVNNHTLVIVDRKKTIPPISTTDFRNYGSSALVNFRSDLAGEGDCNQVVTFISANGEDFCLKSLDEPVGSREMFNADTGLYYLVGYYSILRGVFPFEAFDKEKEIESFLVEHEAVDPLDPAVFRLRIGTADQAIDPNVNNGKCGVLWMQLKNEPIKCRYNFTPAEYVAKKIKPSNAVQWNFLSRGRYLAYELIIAAPDNSAPITGAASISHLEVGARLV